MTLKYTLTDDKGRFYLFWDKDNYGEPFFSTDYVVAKKMTAQGCSSAKRMLERSGYMVERQLVADKPKGPSND
jgi:hypothetical protein